MAKRSQRQRQKEAEQAQFERQQALRADEQPEAPAPPVDLAEYGVMDAQPGQRVSVVTADGEVGTVLAEEIPLLVKAGGRPLTPDEYIHEVKKAQFEANEGAPAAFGYGLISGGTMGLADLITPDEFQKRGELARELHPYSAGAGELVGLLGTALIPGAPANLAARAGQAVTELGRGAGLVTRLGTEALGGAVEGGIVSAGLSAGAAARQGEDAEGIAAAALKGGLLGGAFSGGITLGMGIVGEPIRRTLQKRMVEPILSETVAPALKEELSRIKDVVATRARVAKTGGKIDDLVVDLQKEVEALKARQAGPEVIADAEMELLRVKESLKTDQNLFRTYQARAKQEYEDIVARATQDSAQAAERAADTVLAVRSAWDPVWSQAKLLGDRVGFGEVETVQAYRGFMRAQKAFDDFFVESVTKGKHVATKIETHDAATIAAKIRANPDQASKIVGEYERAGQGLVQRMEAEGMLVPPDPLRPLRPERNPNTGAVYSPRNTPLEIYSGGQEAFTEAAQGIGIGATRPVSGPAEIEAGLRLSAETGIRKNLARQDEISTLLRDMKADRTRFSAKVDELGRAREKATAIKEKLKALDELAARQSELEPLVNDLEAVAKEHGIHIKPADVAAAAIELGVDDPRLKWIARLHLLARGLKGGAGIFDLLPGKLGSLIHTERLGRWGVRRMIPGQGLMRELVIDAAGTAIGREAKAILTPGLALKRAPGATLSPLQIREQFQSRVRAAMTRLGKVTEAPKRLVRMTTTEILNGVRFHPMTHEGDSGVPENQRLFERRMKELDAATQDLASTREGLRVKLTRRTVLDDSDSDATVEAMARTLAFLKSKAPPARPTSPWDKHRNNSDLEIEDWSQYARYTLDPPAVMEDLAAGTLHPAGVEVLREVYPAWYSSMQQELVARVSELRDTLPYEQRVLIGNSFGLVLDGSDDPQVAIVLQRVSQRPPPEPPPQRAPMKNREEPTTGQVLGQR